MARVDLIGGSLAPDEVLVVQAITDGTYFVENGTPTNTGDDTNFTLASAPNPASSLQVYKSGARLRVTDDYTLSTPTNIQLVSAIDPSAGDTITVDYRFSPV